MAACIVIKTNKTAVLVFKVNFLLKRNDVFSDDSNVWQRVILVEKR